MKLHTLTVGVPAPLPKGTEPDNARRAAFGEAAAQIGTPDYGMNGGDSRGTEIDAADVISNILHWVESQGGNPDEALRRGSMNFDAEIGGEE